MNMLVRDMMPQQSTHMDEVDLEQIALLFATLANSARLAIFCRIIEREWSVNDLADEVGLRQSALSQHLRKLRDAKVVKTRRERQIVYYRCADATVLRLLSQVGLIGSEQLITELPSI
ncbi:MAG: ArsR/SmtB family transcription factor [Agrobacterium tumefaciens]